MLTEMNESDIDVNLEVVKTFDWSFVPLHNRQESTGGLSWPSMDTTWRFWCIAGIDSQSIYRSSLVMTVTDGQQWWSTIQACYDSANLEWQALWLWAITRIMMSLKSHTIPDSPLWPRPGKLSYSRSLKSRMLNVEMNVSAQMDSHETQNSRSIVSTYHSGRLELSADA